MDLKRMLNRAKHKVDEHGGTAALKDDFHRARKAAGQPGSVKDKATAVRDALTHKDDHPGDAEDVAPLAEDRLPSQAGSQPPPQTEAPPPSAGA